MDKIEQGLQCIVGEFRGVVMDCYSWCLIHPYITTLLGLFMMVGSVRMVIVSGYFDHNFSLNGRSCDRDAPWKFVGGTFLCIFIPVLLIVFWAQGV